MRKSLLFGLTLLLALAFTVPALAQLKVGVVDVEWIIVKSKKGKSAKQVLKKKFDKSQADLNRRQKELLEIKKRLENPSDMMTNEQKRADMMAYQQGVVKLQEDFVKSQESLAKKELELMKPILKGLEKVINSHAESGGFDLVLARSQHGVLFAKKPLDVTEAVLSKFDAAP